MIDPQFDATIEMLGLRGQREGWARFWPAEAALGGEWALDTAGLEEFIARVGVSAEPAGALRRGMAGLLANPAARALQEQVSRTLAIAHSPPPPMPLPDPALGTWADLFQALAVIGAWPAACRRHRQRGIPEAVTRATFADLERKLLEYREAHGIWGCDRAGWLFHHLAGHLVALGRLQYIPNRRGLMYHVFTGPKGFATLAADGLRLRPDGQFLSADRGLEAAGPSWVTRLAEGNGWVEGHRVNASGAIEIAPTRLALSEWRRAIGPETPLLDIHIPGGASLAGEAVDASLRQALEFFPTYFPELPFAGFMCVSWLMDSQLAKRLPPGSNVVGFLRRFQSLPWPGGNDSQTFERVFGGPVSDLASAPRRTAMQRAILAHVEAGERWRHAGGVMPCEALLSGDRPG